MFPDFSCRYTSVAAYAGLDPKISGSEEADCVYPVIEQKYSSPFHPSNLKQSISQ